MRFISLREKRISSELAYNGGEVICSLSRLSRTIIHPEMEGISLEGRRE